MKVNKIDRLFRPLRKPRWIAVGESPDGIVSSMFRPTARHVFNIFRDANYRELQKICYHTRSRAEGVYDLLGTDLTYNYGPGLVSAFNEIYVNRVFDLGDISRDPKLIDAGANIGLASMYWLDRYESGNAIAFEPDPGNFACLEKNLARFGTRATVRKQALAAFPGKAKFSATSTDHSSICDDESGVATIDVDVASLAEVVEEAGEVELLKIDIEGAEFDALGPTSGKLGKVKRIFVECHSFSDREQVNLRVIDLLLREGFRCYIHSVGVTSRPFSRERKSIEGNLDQCINVFAVRE